MKFPALAICLRSSASALIPVDAPAPSQNDAEDEIDYDDTTSSEEGEQEDGGTEVSIDPNVRFHLMAGLKC